jgi:NAD(P) transhydrogenase subunit beta
VAIYIIEILYLVASVLFILGLKYMSGPTTAKQGMFLAQIGMLLAVIGTLLQKEVVSFTWIVAGIVIGSAVGAILATKIQMTAMPQMVALLNGFGGIASAFVGGAEYLRTMPEIGTYGMVTIGLTVLIGAVTFTGSVIAFAKLQELMRGAPIVFPGQNAFNAVLGIASLGLLGYLVVAPGSIPAFIALSGIASIVGVLVVLPIGGADMPVVISLLNSYSGIAAAASGFVLRNDVLIISGALVGSSGIILSNLMCKAMNRSLTNVLFGAFGQVQAPAPAAPSATGAPSEKPKVWSGTPKEAAEAFKRAKQVIMVPGYGMAVAQAQHAVRELANLLEEEGKTVKYAIHPVAGRMPGHMNVLLAEANVPYDQLIDMDDINPEFAQTQVSLVLGANDVVNPAAKTDPSSPIYGMPILDVENSETVIVIKRSMNPGFAGIDNALFYRPNTMMVFGDAKGTVEKITAALKELGSS